MLKILSIKMTITQEIVREFNRGDFSWRVPSKSEPGKYHIVSFSEDGGWNCDCIAFEMSKKKPKICKHIDLVKKNYEPN